MKEVIPSILAEMCVLYTDTSCVDELRRKGSEHSKRCYPDAVWWRPPVIFTLDSRGRRIMLPRPAWATQQF